MSTGSSGQPNVLFIICDDLNNALASMGRTPFAPAPNLRRLMRRGVRFTNAHNNCPICLPSRNSMLSGLYPHTTGHYTLWDRWRTQRPIPTTSGGREYAGIPLLGEAIMLPKHFRDHGYRTFGVGKVHHQGETDSSWWTEYAYGPDYGPFLWDEIRQAQRARPDRVWLYEGEPMLSYTRRYEGLDRFFLDGERFRHHVEMAFGSLPEVFSDADTEIRGTNGAPFRYVSDDDRDPLPDEKTTGWAVDILRQDHDRPFFLAVGYMKPHTPLNVPERWFDHFPLDEIALPPFLEDDVDDCARALVEHRPYGFLAYDMILKGGERLWRKWLQSYLACVAFVDEQVGTLLDALDENGHSDDTIIVFTSDNGYHMGEKSYIYKDSLWEESGQIPLIVSAPGVGGSDRVCTQPVSLVDLYPTLIDLCDLPGDPHAATHGHPLEGHSLRPLLDDPEDGVWAGPSVAITSVRGDTGIHHSVRSERYRYTLCQNGEEELYDHDADPYEWHNRAGDPRYATDQVALRQQMMHLLYP